MLDHLRTLREDRDLNLNIPIPVLKELALYFDTSVDYLLGLTNHPTPYPRA